MALITVILLSIQSSAIVLATDIENTISEPLTEVEFVDFIDISVDTKAELNYNGQTSTEKITLEKTDFTKEHVTLTATQSDQEKEVTIDFEKVNREDEKIRLNGIYLIGTKENPVIYKIQLTKEIAFSLNEETETILIVFEHEFDYWSDVNIGENGEFAIALPTSKVELKEEVPAEEPKQEEIPEEEPKQEEIPEEEPKQEEMPAEEPKQEEIPPEEMKQEEIPPEEPKQEAEPTEESIEQISDDNEPVDNNPIDTPPVKEEPQYGTLTIEKKVVGEKDWDDVFEVLITGEDIEFSQKKELKNGESLTLDSIPVGSYKIQEVIGQEDVHLYDLTIYVDGAKKEEDSCKVEITENKNVTVTLKSTVKTVLWNADDVKAEALLTGRHMKAKEFKFEMVDSDGKIVTTGTVDGANKNEKAAITWMDATIIYNRTGTYSYTVRQVIPSVKAGGVTYDQNTFLYTIKVTNKEGTLAIETIFKEEIIFKNEYDVKDAPITVGGNVTLDAGNRKMKAKEFLFTIIETDNKGIPIKGAQTIEMYNNENGAFQTTLIYKLKDVGTHYYLVTQKVLGEKGMKYGVNNYLLQIDVADHGDGTLKITPKNHENIKFTNIYEAEKKFSIQTKVKLDGRTLESKEFTFKLKPISENAPMPKTTTAVNAADGNVGFEHITYDENDIGNTYVYHIYQLKGDDKEITYDKNAYEITVTVTDKGNAELTVTQSAVFTFINKYGEAAVKTGDYTPMKWYAGAMIAAMMALIVLEIRNKNKKL